MKANRQLTLSSKLRNNVRQGRLMPALVIDVFYDRATVKLGVSGTGARMENLLIVGGPIEAGDSVFVDSTTPEPTVVAIGQKGISASDLSDALANLELGNGITSEKQLKIILFSGGAEAGIFDPTPEGLQAALDAASPTDVVWLPDVRISADITVPEDVTLSGISSRESIIFGTITLGENSVLENLKVVMTSSYVETLSLNVTAIESQAIIRNCEIHAYQCSNLNATAILMDANTLLDLSYSIVVGHSESGQAYCIEFTAGSSVRATHTNFWASTEWFTGTGAIEEYANTEGFEESAMWCNSGAITFPNNNGAFNMGTLYGTPKVGAYPIIPDDVEFFSPGSNPDLVGDIIRRGDYLYYSYWVSSTAYGIREFKISTGDTVDLAITGTKLGLGKFVVVADRKCIALSNTSTTIPGDLFWANSKTPTVWLADFAAETVTEETKIMSTHGDMGQSGPGGVGGDYWWRNTYTTGQPFVTADDSGDTIVAVVGCFVRNTRFEMEYTEGGAPFGNSKIAHIENVGRFVATKNWSQGGDWTIAQGTYIPVNQGTFGTEEELSESINAVMVTNRYIVFPDIIKSLYTYPPGVADTEESQRNLGYFISWKDEAGATQAWPFVAGETDDEYYRIDNYWLGFVVIDMLEPSVSFYYNIIDTDSIWANGLIDPYYRAPDHLNQCAYYTVYPDNLPDPEVDDVEYLWELNIGAQTLGIVLEGETIDDDFGLLWSQSQTLITKNSGTDDFVIMEANSQTILNAAFTDTKNLIWKAYSDPTMDDALQQIWSIDPAANKVVLFDPFSTDEEILDCPVTMEDGATLYCFGDVFVIRQYEIADGDYHYYLIRRT